MREDWLDRTVAREEKKRLKYLRKKQETAEPVLVSEELEEGTGKRFDRDALIIYSIWTFMGLLTFFIVATWTYGSVMTVNDALDESEQEKSVQTEAAAPEPEPVSVPESEPETEPSEPLNWQPLIWVGSGALALAVLGGGYRGVSNISRSRKESMDKKVEVKSLREAAEKRHQNVLVQYSAYETDVWKALSYPALHDVEVEETSTFLKAMRDAEAQKKMMQKDEKMASNYLYERYMDSISHLEQTFTVAENKAIRLGDGNLSEDEQKDIKTAKMLLSHAEDSGNNDEVRANYYEQLKKVIGRLNERHKTPVIPEPAFAQLEKNARLVLTTSGVSVDGADIEAMISNGTNGLLNNNTLSSGRQSSPIRH